MKAATAMQCNQAGPPGLEDWEAQYPALLAEHGAPINQQVALAEAPAQVLELLALVEAHPLELTWDDRKVGLREIDKAKLAESMDDLPPLNGSRNLGRVFWKREGDGYGSEGIYG